MLKDKCFSPCGGDPIGLWKLAGNCLAHGSRNESKCSPYGSASQNAQSPFTLLLDDEGILRLSGESPSLELWFDMDSSCGYDDTIACSDLINKTRSGTLLDRDYESGPSNGCSSVCGHTCVCGGSPAIQFPQTWESGGNLLVFQDVGYQNYVRWSAPHDYCVDGDVMWLGATVFTDDGSLYAAFRFERVACVGTPVPCEQRSRDQCKSSDGCVLHGGECKLSAGNPPENEPTCLAQKSSYDCTGVAGCEWIEIDGCSGAADPCSFRNCGATPGCTIP